ncbi:MAG: hypothetical protein A3A97_04590 [Candidatus Terrybacteria bacterium RIFCSPLOWO2_01_FULL_40_23]|uniref:N-acetyltransferase domain-containing protein n=1 Tax=Candidatus Terrybacteria bacterium RIFCSPLOWO2_01_FULL_40_23 TaxID=1802366 RepID=A0A1G2PV16_9BACT|nr:MAG: hypothetical protein A3A97_04590 [Candidatus Terrybacteria bacterium RIFCSPLOWO2_01_FULL_40_23]
MPNDNKDKIFLIRLAKNHKEKRDAQEFISQIALSRYQATPPPLPEILFIAYENGKIVGTLGFDTASKQDILPLEKIWQFDPNKTPFPFEREMIVQYGRWTAIKPEVSRALSYTATIFARTLGKKIIMFEAKPSSARRLQTLGARAQLVPATLLIKNIPEDGRPYYSANPAPKLYMLDLMEFETALTHSKLLISSIQYEFNSLYNNTSS